MTRTQIQDADDINRRYFAHYVAQVAPPGAVVLDYGCGAGTLVGLLRASGYDAHGADIRWPGATGPDIEESELGRQGVLRYYEEGGRLPFDDDTFDVVVSDMVFEHVVPLEASVRELERVLRRGGVAYHHFPTLTLWREGHIGIPLAHRMPPGRARLAYTTALRRAGLGMFKDDRPAREWAIEKLEWIDRWTVYRPPREIAAIFGRNADLVHREIDYCRFRAADRRWLGTVLSWPVSRRPAEVLFRRLGFEAIEMRPR